MRFSVSALITALLFAISSPLVFASTGAGAAGPKPDTTPDLPPTKTTVEPIKARQTTPNLLAALYQLATEFDIRACLLVGGAIPQALSQTSRELEDVCKFSITGSVGDTFTSFLPSWYEWYNAHSGRIASIVTKCPKAGALVQTIEAYETCSQVVSRILAASASASASATSVGVSGGSSEELTTTTPAPGTMSTDSPGAAEETGFLGAVVAAAAGLMGIAAVL
ncbi:hypothetical protein GQX73_g8487 [Xylaria multiplex]|uniref:Uncharacterized protein n=1 Tax=Xylaria multiplex TaxID=323545 RepID=A0A7C8MTB1_9PEZI|nr:hypothetical protein GQX73_g8487 [Xylaria multiplex]